MLEYFFGLVICLILIQIVIHDYLCPSVTDKLCKLDLLK